MEECGFSSSAGAYSVGDIVTVKRHGKATVSRGLVQESSSQYFGRYQVQYLADGKMYWARPDMLRPYQKPSTRVLVTETTTHYRAAACEYTLPDDVVLEVGCHEGVTTDLLHRRCRWVLGVDLNSGPVTKAKARYPHVQFEQIDGFDIRRLTALSPTGTYSKIFIDIGGIAQLHVVMSLVGLYYKAFKGSVLIVKNKYFKNLLGNVQVYVPQGELMHGNHSAVWQQNGAQAVCQPSNKNKVSKHAPI
eukprot:GHRR01005210.1.p1 GENE.GHRR01005210.1~~GHRR01005210.1.p1  ORF type:complete len:247 (+),score=33.41 GHRR01005210.1:58-798(+)